MIFLNLNYGTIYIGFVPTPGVQLPGWVLYRLPVSWIQVGSAAASSSGDASSPWSKKRRRRGGKKKNEQGEGGAAYRTMLQVQTRGRWASEKSVLRYGKTMFYLRALAAVPVAIKEKGLRKQKALACNALRF